MKPRRTVVAGGGTAGHVVPSLEIARALVARGHDPEEVELYGSRRGQESRVWPTLEFPYTLLPGRGIQRRLAPSALWANAGAVLGLAWAAVRATASFVMRRPRVVVLVGGYASFAAGIAAVLTRVHLVTVTTDAVPGAVNRLFGPMASANAVAFPGTRIRRATVTGTPVLAALQDVDRSPDSRRAARQRLGLPPDRMTVTAVGGSLGARRINTAVADLAEHWGDRDDLTLFHVTGRRDYETFARPDRAAGPGRRPGDTGGGLHYEVIAYEDRIVDFMGAADVMISRAGAMTVAERLLTGVPGVLVPLPGAPRDHQTRNAEAVVAAGGAVLVPDHECDARRLAAELEPLLADDARREEMGAAARRLGHSDAAQLVAALVDSCAR